MSEVTNRIKEAINDLTKCIGILGAEQECLSRLRELRCSKTTWVGKEENDLRFIVDRILRGEANV